MRRVTKYGCSDYRNEMILIKLKKRLNDNGLSEKEKKEIKSEINRLEKEMNLD